MLFVVAVVVVIVHMYRLPVHFLHLISYFSIMYTLKAKTKECIVKTMNKQFPSGFREQ